MPAFFGYYLAAHVVSYMGLFRKLPWFRAERGIFLFHAAPALAWGVVLASWVSLSDAPDKLNTVLLIISVHGIYSMTFLEFWSLSQGGYSLSILDHLQHNQEGMERHSLPLAQMGNAKLNQRVQGLKALGLIAADAQQLSLSWKGRLAGRCCQLIAFLANIRKEG